ncbi:MAG: PAS domain-containing protein [Candidatus Aquicultor sp.]
MAEDALKQQLRILETIAEGILIVDIAGTITYANESAEEILGVERSKLIGRPYNNPGYTVTTLEGKPYPVEERPISEAIKTGEIVRNVEYIVVRPDGRKVIISVNAGPVRDEAGATTAAVISFADITTRKLAEMSLKESERRFRDMLEKAELVAIILDVQGNIIFANDFFLDLTGWFEEDVLGKDWFALFIPPEQRAHMKQVFREIITKGAPTHYDIDILTEERETRTISLSNVLLRDEQGTGIGVASIGEDVTERERAAEEIRGSRREVLDILESITDGFIALDNLWRITYVNRKAAQLVGRKREELLFKNIWEALPELVGTIFYTEYLRAKEQMVPVTFEELYPRKMIRKYLNPDYLLGLMR